jgi:hypothetical protein
LDDIGDFGAQVMILSYLALALAIVLFLAGIAGTTFTFRTIAQRHAEHPHIKAHTWHSISAPVYGLQLYYIRIDSERRHARFSRLLYRGAYYVALSVSALAYHVAHGVATIEKVAVSFIELFR